MVAVRWRFALLLTAVYSDEDPHISRECDADRVSHYHATCRLDASHAWFVRQENAAVVDVHHGVAFHPILKAASSAVHNEMRYLDGHNFRIAADDTNIREVKASCCDDGSYAGVLNFTGSLPGHRGQGGVHLGQVHLIVTYEARPGRFRIAASRGIRLAIALETWGRWGLAGLVDVVATRGA